MIYWPARDSLTCADSDVIGVLPIHAHTRLMLSCRPAESHFSSPFTYIFIIHPGLRNRSDKHATILMFMSGAAAAAAASCCFSEHVQHKLLHSQSLQTFIFSSVSRCYFVFRLY